MERRSKELVLCILALAALTFPAVGLAYRGTKVADPTHSSIDFRTQHWGILDIIGWFEDYDIRVELTDNDFETAAVVARMRPASVRMPNAGMAKNLRGMFDIESYPEIVFESTSVRKNGENSYILVGNLAIKGVTKRVEWDVVFNGFGYPPGTMPGFTASTTINRLDFGVGQPEDLPSGAAPTIGEQVHITCNLRLVWDNEIDD